MPLIILLGCLLFFVLLITKWEVNTFLAFLVISFLAGLLLGMPPETIIASVQKGIGDMLGPLVILIVAGAMIGRITADSGAALKIAAGLSNAFGVKNIPWALMITGFIIGIPLFYNVGFILVIPLIFSIAIANKIPPVATGIAMLASLSVTHGFLPPHPSPAALIPQFKADLGTTLGYGLLIAIPTVIIAGPLFARTLTSLQTKPAILKPATGTTYNPGLGLSIIASLLPVILILTGAFIQNIVEIKSGWLMFLTDPVFLMLISLIFIGWLLASGAGMPLKAVMNSYQDGIKEVGMILLVLAGAGAMKQVMLDSGLNLYLQQNLTQLTLHPLFMGWLLAAIIRVALGSATVAGLTAASIVLPVWQGSGVDPNLMVLAIGSGSLMFSHINDAGFWLFKEYFNTTISQTIRSWSVMETIISISGLIGVFILYYVI